MNILQYLMLGMSAVVIAGTPFMLVKAIRRKQKHRLVEVPSAMLMLIYVTVDIVWPNAIPSAPKFVHHCVLALIVAWIFEFFGGFRWLFNRRNAVSLDRRS